MNDTAITEEFVPWKSRLWISGADSAIAILQTVIAGGALTYFFTRVRGLSPENAATVWLIFAIWNAINDPLFGYISDRTKSKLGRRKPYIRYGAPLVALAFVFLWLDLPATQTILFFQLLVGLFFYDLLYTAIATSIYIMPYEMAVSNKARSSIFVWKIIFMIFPNVFPFVIALIQPGPGEDPSQFRLLMMLLSLVMGLIIFFSTYFYQEKHFQQSQEQPPFISAIKESFKNFAFIIFLVVSFSIIYIQTALMQGVAYYFDEINSTPIPDYIGLAIGILTGILFWINFRDRLGVKTCLKLWLGIFALGCLIMLLLGRLIVPSILSFFFIGVGFAGGMYLIPIMNGDVIDHDEERTGLRREGMYAGINSLVTKPAISLAQSVFLIIITRYGYNQSLSKGLQSNSAEQGILIAWMLIPSLLLLLSLVVMRWYPLAGDQWNKTKEKLAALHAQKEIEHLRQLGSK